MVPTGLKEAPLQVGTWSDVESAVSARADPGLWARLIPDVSLGGIGSERKSFRVYLTCLSIDGVLFVKRP